MSFNVRDDNALFGPGAGVEIPNGAAASTVALLQVMEPVEFFAATAAAAVTQTVFISPPAASLASGLPPLGTYQLIGVSLVYSTASSSGTVQAEKTTGTTAPGSGTNLLTAAITTSTTANTVKSGTLVSNPNTLTFNATDRLNFVFAGTQTGLVDLCIVAYITRVS